MKIKIYLILSLVIIFSSAYALSVTWYGTSCFLLEDGDDAILFDPFLTRASKLDIILFKDLKSDPVVVNKWLPLEKRKKIKAIFVSHSHYDHILDVGEIQKDTTANLYGSKSTLIIGKASGINANFLKKIKINDKLKVGGFEVGVFKGEHPSHFLNVTMADGPVDKNFSYPSSAFSYKMGEVFTYLVKVNNKTIFINASSAPFTDFKVKIDLMIQGLTYSSSYDEIIKKQIIPSNTGVVIPSHHDDFFVKLSNKVNILSSANIKLFQKKLPGDTKILNLEIGKTLTFHE